MTGRILIGPLPSDAATEDIEEALERYNLFIARDADVELDIVKTADGAFMTAEGYGVKGYLVDSDGLEAAESDVEDFFARFLRPSGTIGINGRHEAPGGVIILCRTTIRLCPERGCQIAAQRTHVALDNGPGLIKPSRISESDSHVPSF